MKKFIAGENENGVRLSRFVESVTRDMPRSLLYKSFRNKRIKVNGKRGEADTRLSSGDVIELYINDEFFPEKPVVPAKKPPLPFCTRTRSLLLTTSSRLPSRRLLPTRQSSAAQLPLLPTVLPMPL